MEGSEDFFWFSLFWEGVEEMGEWSKRDVLGEFELRLEGREIRIGNIFCVEHQLDWSKYLVVIVNVVLWIRRKRERFDERSREGRMMARGLLFLTVVRYLSIFINRNIVNVDINMWILYYFQFTNSTFINLSEINWILYLMFL